LCGAVLTAPHRLHQTSSPRVQRHLLVHLTVNRNNAEASGGDPLQHPQPSSLGQPRRRARTLSDKRFATLMMVPAAAFLAVFVGWPLVQFVIDSFFEINIFSDERSFVGFDNYASALASSEFTGAAWRTAAYTAIVVTMEFTLGLAVALLFSALGDRSRVFRTMFTRSSGSATPISRCSLLPSRMCGLRRRSSPWSFSLAFKMCREN
jgi:hypothetical protein